MPSTVDDASRARTWVMALLVLVVLFLAFARRGEVIVDDAYISFRYAENLASGRGLVFNEGERVEGYSNLSYTLLLAAMRLCGVPVVLTAQLVGATAAAATLACLPALARALGASAWRGVAAAAALGVTANFSGWTFRGLETPLFTFLLCAGCLALARDVALGRAASWVALAAFGLSSITRPEGPIYLAAVAVALALARGARQAARFAGLTAIWILQIVFRLAYYGDALPNTYYAKVWSGADRWLAGISYARAFALASGPVFTGALLGCVAVTLLRRRAPATGVVVAVAATALYFAVGSGGEGMPDGRFFHPAMPFLVLLAFLALPGRRGDVVAMLLLALTLGSRTSRPARLALTQLDAGWLRERCRLLSTVEDRAQTRVGRWLRANLPAGTLVAVNDCGVIPYESGLPTLDTVGLMDRHIARLPGRKHQKVDLRYVLSRQPGAIVLALRNLGGGLPYDMRMASLPQFLESYRLATAVPYSDDTAYYVFRRISAPVLPPEFLDLTALLADARCMVAEGDSARAAGDLIAPGYRYYLLPGGKAELAEIGKLAPRPGATLDAAAIAQLDQALHTLGAAAHHGIAVRLPEGSRIASINFTFRGGLPRGRLSLGFGMAPWLYQEHVSRCGATLVVSASDPGFSDASLSSNIAPAEREEDRRFVPVSLEAAGGHHPEIRFEIDRRGPPGSENDPFEVLLEDPRLVTER